MSISNANDTKKILHIEPRSISELIKEYHGLNTFQEKIAIITGGANGIGQALVEGMALLSAKVIFLDKSGDGRKFEAELNRKGHDVRFVEIDLGNRQKLQNIIDNIKDEYSSIDYLVNCASEFQFVPVGGMPFEDWRRAYSVNVDAPFCLISNLLDNIKQGGAIINILSIDGLPLGSAYFSSKSALRSLTLSLANEVKDLGISAYGFAPGVVYTDLSLFLYGKYADILGKSIEEFANENIDNPGYNMKMMPTSHCALAFILSLMESGENNGLIVEPFSYLKRAKIIDYNESDITLSKNTGSFISDYLNSLGEIGNFIESKIYLKTLGAIP